MDDPFVVLLVLDSDYLLLIKVILILVLKLILYKVGSVTMALPSYPIGIVAFLIG